MIESTLDSVRNADDGEDTSPSHPAEAISDAHARGVSEVSSSPVARHPSGDGCDRAAALRRSLDARFRVARTFSHRLSKCVDINTLMAVKTVTLSEDAYNALAALKREGESFSEVVRRLTGSQVLLSSFAGAWIGAPESKVQEVRHYLRDGDRLSTAKLRRLARPKVSRG
jgi:predicted CopG family antitoxin